MNFQFVSLLGGSAQILYTKYAQAIAETRDEFVSLMADCIPTGAKTVQSKYVRSKQLEKRGKLLRYDKVDSMTKSLLNESRLVEWNRYKKYNTVTVI